MWWARSWVETDICSLVLSLYSPSPCPHVWHTFQPQDTVLWLYVCLGVLFGVLVVPPPTVKLFNETEASPLQAPWLWESQRSSGSYSWTEKTLSVAFTKEVWDIHFCILNWIFTQYHSFTDEKIRNQSADYQLPAAGSGRDRGRLAKRSDHCPEGTVLSAGDSSSWPHRPCAWLSAVSLYGYHLTLSMFTVLHSVLFTDIILKINVLNGG